MEKTEKAETAEKAETTLNLNTLLLVLSLLGGAGTMIKYLIPLAVVPDRVEAVDQSVRNVRRDVDDMSKVQALQTDALQRLAKIAEDSANTRRDVDKATTEIQEVKRRLDRLEER